MMDEKQIYAEILKTITLYRQELTLISEDQFEVRPAEDVWSYSEVYHHVFDLSIISMKAIAEIIQGRGAGGKPTLPGRAILAAGAFPPGMRFKVPEQFDGRVRKINRSDAGALISSFEEMLEKLYPLMPAANKELTTAHPRLGDFNAMQWLRFTETHLKHHLKQIERIKTEYSN